MSDEQKTILDKTMNRRDFLKMSGMGAVGVTALSWLLPGCTSNKEDVAVFETASGVLIHESPEAVSNTATSSLLEVQPGSSHDKAETPTAPIPDIFKKSRRF
ncbi:MAG: twin-arginine translocation signal domain-containing protein, partial [Spirochaetia bacterium]